MTITEDELAYLARDSVRFAIQALAHDRVGMTELLGDELNGLSEDQIEEVLNRFEAAFTPHLHLADMAKYASIDKLVRLFLTQIDQMRPVVDAAEAFDDHPGPARIAAIFRAVATYREQTQQGEEVPAMSHSAAEPAEEPTTTPVEAPTGGDEPQKPDPSDVSQR